MFRPIGTSIVANHGSNVRFLPETLLSLIVLIQ